MQEPRYTIEFAGYTPTKLAASLWKYQVIFLHMFPNPLLVPAKSMFPTP